MLPLVGNIFEKRLQDFVSFGNPREGSWGSGNLGGIAADAVVASSSSPDEEGRSIFVVQLLGRRISCSYPARMCKG